MAVSFKLSKKSAKQIDVAVRRTEKIPLNIAKSILNYRRFNRFLRILGPGIVTGAADDDPSGIITYSQTGAFYGISLLWAFPLMYPMLLAVQESCSRIGAVTGKGLAAVLRDNYSKKLLYMAVLLVVIANVVNIGADFSAIANTTQLLVPLPFGFLAISFAVIILLLEILVSYKRYAKILKWLTLSLLAYLLTAILVGQNWGDLLYATTHINAHFDFATIYILVGLLGTTISPYLFFWDTSEVVEDEIEQHRLAENAKKEPRISKRFLRNVRIDNFVGMTIASIGAWFIVVTCASVLHANGITDINSAADAARALEPLVKGFPNAGLAAKLIFSIGVVGLGFLAIPVLAGSSSYAISEAFGWKEGLHRRFKRALGFYGVIIASTLVGLGLNFLGINPIKALIFAAVFNGVSAVPLLFMIARIGNNPDIMGQHKNKLISNIFISLAFIVMLAAAAVLFYSFIFNK
jgi:NRAMP (natural resistance-associated macrophage protein)-like metal ion transporter